MNAIYEAPHYAFSSKLISLHLSSVKTFPSAPYSQTSSVYLPPLMSETKPHTCTKACYDFRQMRREKLLD
jgi:hypothetical protein